MLFLPEEVYQNILNLSTSHAGLKPAVRKGGIVESGDVLLDEADDGEQISVKVLCIKSLACYKLRQARRRKWSRVGTRTGRQNDSIYPITHSLTRRIEVQAVSSVQCELFVLNTRTGFGQLTQ